MREYHKIQSLFLRDPATQHRTFIDGQWTLPEFGYLRYAEWTFSEKIDGTNIRVGWDGEKVTFGGRTDDAQMPTFLMARLVEMFPAAKMLDVFGDRGGITLYGEGYGAKIQKGGGNYIADGQSFILFDIYGGSADSGLWFERSSVEQAATALSIDAAPIIETGDLDRACALVAAGFQSPIAQRPTLAEGVVLRPAVELRTRRGDRIISKLKHRDFATAKPMAA